MKNRVIIMAYDNSSITGDEIVDYYYDIENNFMSPESPFGYFIYKVIGGSFDYLDGLINQFKIDMDLINSNVGDVEIRYSLPSDVDIDTSKTYYIPSYNPESYHFTRYAYVDEEWVQSSHVGKIINTLDTFWGKSYGMTRIEISYLDENEILQKRQMTDDEYKIYLYLKNHPLMTVKDLTTAFTRCFSVSDEEDDVYMSIETGADILRFVDHPNYDNFTNPSLEKMDANDTNALTDFLEDANYDVVSDEKTVGEIIMINIPNKNWDSHFLEFLETFISIKGNVRINQGA